MTGGPRLSRRALLGVAGAGAATVVGAGAVAWSRSDPAQPSYDFYGRHQSGIVTPMQDYLHFAALDVTTKDRDELISLLREWTDASAAMMAGQEIGEYGALAGPYDAPPQDTGEAIGLPAAALTITIGFGPSLFRRFGLRSPVRPLPHFSGDMIEESISGGDLCIQACANDAQVAVHAVRNLVRIAFGRAAVKWSQMGFGRSSRTDSAQATPRNLFGFKDGTANVTGDDPDALDEFVWVGRGDQPPWMHGGSYLAVRKIRMTIETWDRTSMREQEGVFGRTKREGSPLSGGDEFATPDFAMAGADGPLIPADSHMALAHPSANDGQRILRRAYNYTDGSDHLGRLDAGLFFLAYNRDLERQFIPIQARLSRSDLMNEYVRYISSATFAIPPGVEPGGYLGQGLFS